MNAARIFPGQTVSVQFILWNKSAFYIKNHYNQNNLTAVMYDLSCLQVLRLTVSILCVGNGLSSERNVSDIKNRGFF